MGDKKGKETYDLLRHQTDQHKRNACLAANMFCHIDVSIPPNSVFIRSFLFRNGVAPTLTSSPE